jgi:hypothetical protein
MCTYGLWAMITGLVVSMKLAFADGSHYILVILLKEQHVSSPTANEPQYCSLFAPYASRYLERAPVAIQRLAALLSILWNRAVTLLLNALSQCSHMKKSLGASPTTFGTFRHLLCLPRSQINFWCLV